MLLTGKDMLPAGTHYFVQHCPIGQLVCTIARHHLHELHGEQAHGRSKIVHFQIDHKQQLEVICSRFTEPAHQKSVDVNAKLVNQSRQHLLAKAVEFRLDKRVDRKSVV